jgi:hypothetical protein
VSSYKRCILLPVLAIVACIGGSAALAGSHGTPTILPSAKFARLPGGWRAFDREFGLLTRRGGDVESYALSWPYRRNSFGWANSMPRNAIAIEVLLLRTSADGSRINLCLHTPHLGGFPPIRRLPLRLPRTTGDRLEGAPNVPEYRVFGRIDDMYNVDLRVDVNNPRPTPAMLRTAQKVVAAIAFPDWPRRRHC